MTFKFPFKHKFTFIVLFVGFISFAQKMNFDTASLDTTELSELNTIDLVVEELTACYVYSGFVVNKKTGDPIVGAHIEMKNSVSGMVTTLRSDQKGYYKFIMPCNERVKMIFDGEGYSKESRIVRTGAEVKSPSKNNRIYLTPFDSLTEKEGAVVKIKVDRTYFESNKSNTSTWDKNTLDKVLFTMLKFPEIKIRIESRSGAQVDDISNSVVSYFRAKEARRYLIQQGIDATRIENSDGYDLDGRDKDCDIDIDCNQESINKSGSDFIIVSK